MVSTSATGNRVGDCGVFAANFGRNAASELNEPEALTRTEPEPGASYDVVVIGAGYAGLGPLGPRAVQRGGPRFVQREDSVQRSDLEDLPDARIRARHGKANVGAL